MTRKSQSGLSLIGVLFVGAALSAFVLLGLKLIPVLTEYHGIKRSIAAVAGEADPQNASVSQLRNAFSKRATVDDITSISPADLDITKEDGRIVISVDYSRKIHLFYNVSLVIDFSTSTGPSR
ncbi:MAG: DUF4845 domain-containing protein [Zoogloea sp.]|uniref:DUF4845 domain-containing protein n=1 Tax=Zoogloea sp. TaxID=49181 RepID=UPI002605C253|nr:DUF4845 domain-containing protein [Zoogloea sp.]MDD2988611.1 DUF4845 domain-containing protein [Zoogloea sp.]